MAYDATSYFCCGFREYGRVAMAIDCKSIDENLRKCKSYCSHEQMQERKYEFIRSLIKEKEKKMDREIKKAKKKNDVEMDRLLVKDKKMDKKMDKCEKSMLKKK